MANALRAKSKKAPKKAATAAVASEEVQLTARPATAVKQAAAKAATAKQLAKVYLYWCMGQLAFWSLQEAMNDCGAWAAYYGILVSVRASQLS